MKNPNHPIGPKSKIVLDVITANPGCNFAFIRNNLPNSEAPKSFGTHLTLLVTRKKIRRQKIFTGYHRLVGNWIYFAVN